jgi:hypothetical protein
MTHTPGPWAVDRFTSKKRGEHYRGIIQESGEFWIANLPAEHEYAEGDANLIAAAPELLAELENLHELISINGFDDHSERVQRLINKARGN